MDPAQALTEFVKVYGPLGIGWVAAFYLLRFVLSRYDDDVKSRTDLAEALRELTNELRSKK